MDTTSTDSPAPKKPRKSNKEVFQAVMAKNDVPVRDAPTSLQGEDEGPIMLKSTPLPALTPVAEPVAEADVSAPTTPAVSIPPDDLARARLAMIRSGFLPSEVDALEPAQILERGSKRQKAIEADDEAWRDANEWRSKKSQAPTDRKDQAQPLSTERAAPAPDLKASLKPLADALLLDESGLELMERSFASLVQTAVQPLRAELDTLKQTGTKRDERGEQVVIESARAKLVDQIPELADPARYREVYAEMEALATRPKYQAFKSAPEAAEALMRDAAQIAGLQAVSPSLKDEERKRQRADSRTTLPPSTTEAGPQTLRDQQWRYFKHIREHPGDVVGARRAGGYA